MKKRVSVPVPVLVLACVLSLLAGGLAVFGAIRASVGPGGMALLQTQALIQSRFVGDYDPDDTRQAAERAMVDSLGDRWSYYLTPEEYLQTTATRENSYVGIGVTIQEDDRGLMILSVNPGGPAAQAGLAAGEIICAVDGVPITPIGRDDAIQSIRGEAGTAVTLEILDKAGESRSVEVVRGAVRNISAQWKMIGEDTALLTIANFYTGAADQVADCLEELTEEGARALVIDVRNDPGGYVTELTDILDQLLPKGDIFRMEYYNGAERVYTSSGESRVDLPMAVLVNENSYSAAEFLAAQIHETTGAPLVGTRTSGKGYSQNLYRLRDGSAVNLSSGRYFTGGGVSLIGTGLVPDPYVGLSYARQLDLLMGDLAPEEDGQLQAALAALDAGKGADQGEDRDSCRFVNDMLQNWEKKKGRPSERPS